MNCVILLIICACLALVFGIDGSPCNSSLECAIFNDQEEFVKEILNNNSEIINARVNGDLPTHFAAKHKKENMVKILIDYKFEIIDLKNNEGKTVLFVAVEKNGTVSLVTHLIGKGADVNTKDDLKQTPLHWSAGNGNENVAKLLIENNAIVNTKDTYEITPLHWSAQYGRENVAKLLIKNNADVHVKEENGSTPLHWAAQFGHKNVGKLLIENKADMNVKDMYGYTPLLWAALKGHKDMVELLVENNADVNARNNHDQTACDLIEEKDREAIWPILKCTP